MFHRRAECALKLNAPSSRDSVCRQAQSDRESFMNPANGSANSSNKVKDRRERVLYQAPFKINSAETPFVRRANAVRSDDNP